MKKVRRLLADRLGEPLHLNLLAAAAAVVGSYRTKIEFDLVSRRPYALGIQTAADLAAEWGPGGPVYLFEFGVAAGDGLLNMASIARRIGASTGIDFRVVGFDTGRGLPAPVDYRDHPEYYQGGDYPMEPDVLRSRLPANTELVLGDIADTLPPFLDQAAGVVGFVSVDVDYYSSTRDLLAVFELEPQRYFPVVPVYFDDVGRPMHNESAGERLAIKEFNDKWELRRLEPFHGLVRRRIFKRAPYLSQMYALHVLDHPVRAPGSMAERPRQVLRNRYLT